MPGRLQDRTALVTGSTSGIGKGIALALAAEGAHVVINGRDAERGAAVVAEIAAGGGRADFVAADLGAAPDAVRALAAEATAVLGGHVDVLVNNAGIFPSSPNAEVSDATLDAVLAVNVRAPHVLTAAIAPAMAARGSGAIVNVGSWVASIGAGTALYSGSKAALEQFSRSWAFEYGPSGVRVNAIAPGVTLTEGTAPAREILDRMVAGTPAGRLGTPADIAAGVVYLASDEASFVHGATLQVDGGALTTRPR